MLLVLERGPEGALDGGEVVGVVLRDGLGELLGARRAARRRRRRPRRRSRAPGPAAASMRSYRADERHARIGLHRRLLAPGRSSRARSPARRSRGDRGTSPRARRSRCRRRPRSAARPPAQTPLTAAITGFPTPLCQAVSRSATSRVRRDCSRSASLSRASWRTSRPVWNASPLPVLTITRTSGSASSSCHAVSSSASIVASIALAASGRSNTSQPTGPSRRTSSVA